MIARALRSVASHGRGILGEVGARVALRRCDDVAEGVRLLGRASIQNRGYLEIGRDTTICSRPIATQVGTEKDGTLHIGAGVTIAHGCTIVATGLVSIGDYTRIGPFSLLCDADDDRLAWTGATQRMSRPIVIDPWVRIGSEVTVLPGTFIGSGAEIAPGSVVSGVVPPGAFASGVAAPAASSPRAASSRADVRERLAQLVAEVFDRSSPPPLSLEPEQLSAWGAHGALRLLLAVEREFATRIPDHEWLGMRSLEDLATILERRAADSGQTMSAARFQEDAGAGSGAC